MWKGVRCVGSWPEGLLGVGGWCWYLWVFELELGLGMVGRRGLGCWEG